MNQIKWRRRLMPVVYLWRIIFPIIFSILLIVLAFYAFNVNDQGRDFFVGVVNDGISLTYLIKSSLFLALWCLILWYSNRIVLQVKEIDAPANALNSSIIAWLPRILGITPYLIVIASLLKAHKLVREENSPDIFLNVAIPAATAVAMMLFFVYRSKIARLLHIDFVANDRRFSTERTTLYKFLLPRATRFAIISILIATGLMAALFFTPLEWGYARFLQPATVVLSGFIFINVLLTIAALTFSPRRSPFFLVIIIYILWASTCNNNNSIRTITGDSPLHRMTVDSNFNAWIKHKLARNTGDSIFPITIVAAEGGGIRAASWTALVLNKLQGKDSSFIEHVYAISGVSGGGVGASFYVASLHDQLNTGSRAKNLEAAVSADFLSDLTAGFLYQDNLQRLLPFPVTAFSRNNKLEDSWAWAYQKNMSTQRLDSSFLQLWEGDNRYRIPNLLLNGLLAETGEKAITSNLDLDSTGAFRDDMDVLEVLDSDIALKTAASLCARFPVITSGALLKRNGSIPVGHVLDGGYKENSGIETAWQLCLTLSPLIREAEMRYKVSLPVRIVFIQNSNDGRSYDENDSGTAKILPDLTTIIPGFLNAWDRRTTSYKDITKDLFSNPSLRERFSFYDLRLNNRERSLPLGWFLSSSARKQVALQADTLRMPF